MRLFRFATIALLARHYGDRVRQILESQEIQTGLIALVFVASAVMIASATVLFRRTRPPALQPVPSSKVAPFFNRASQ